MPDRPNNPRSGIVGTTVQPSIKTLFNPPGWYVLGILPIIAGLNRPSGDLCI